MNKRQIVALQYKCLCRENEARTPEARKYWARQFFRLTELARKLGWID